MPEALDRLPLSGAPILVFTGEPSIGKTRVLEETAEMARQRGAVALRGVATEMDASHPFGMLVDALDRQCGGKVASPSLVAPKPESARGRSRITSLAIGAPGFEPGTSPTRTVRATRLRHAPKTAASLAAPMAAEGVLDPAEARPFAHGVLELRELRGADRLPRALGRDDQRVEQRRGR